MTRLLVVIALVSVSCSRLLSAEPAPAPKPAFRSEGLSLSEVLRFIRGHNPALKAARASIDAAQGRLRQSRLYPNPEFEIEVEDLPTNKFGSFARSANTVLFAQEIVTAGKRKAGIAVAATEAKVTEQEYALLQREILAEGKKAFSGLLAAQERVAVSERLLAISKRNADASRERVKAGGAALVEAVRAEVALARAEAALREAENQKANARKELRRIMGAPGRGPVRVGEPGALYRTPPALPDEKKTRAALAEHPQLAASSLAHDVADRELQLAKRERWPNFEVGLGVETVKEDGEREETLVLSVGIPLPLFDRNQGAIAEAEANRRKAQHERQAGHDKLATRLDQALQDYTTARRQVESYREKIVPGARRSFELVNRAYQAGEISQIELLEAQQTQAETELEYVDALGALWEALAELEALVGEDLVK